MLELEGELRDGEIVIGWVLVLDVNRLGVTVGLLWDAGSLIVNWYVYGV